MANNPTISQIKIGTTTYDIHDAYARNTINKIHVYRTDVPTASACTTAINENTSAKIGNLAFKSYELGHSLIFYTFCLGYAVANASNYSFRVTFRDSTITDIQAGHFASIGLSNTGYKSFTNTVTVHNMLFRIYFNELNKFYNFHIRSAAGFQSYTSGHGNGAVYVTCFGEEDTPLYTNLGTLTANS